MVYWQTPWPVETEGLQQGFDQNRRPFKKTLTVSLRILKCLATLESLDVAHIVDDENDALSRVDACLIGGPMYICTKSTAKSIKKMGGKPSLGFEICFTVDGSWKAH